MQTALHVASQRGHASCVAALMSQSDCNPDARDDSGDTALHGAARDGVPATLAALLADRR